MSLLTAVRPVIVQVQEGSGGISLESILVFAGGVLAAVAAVVAALVTTRAASKRLQRSLEAERERFERQLNAEGQRIERQLEHERHKDRRAEAGATVERIARTVSRNSARVTGMALNIMAGNSLSTEELTAFDQGLDELREEFSILMLHFEDGSPVVAGLGNYLKAVNHVLPPVKELPLKDDEQKAELEQHVKEMDSADIEFLETARESLDSL